MTPTPKPTTPEAEAPKEEEFCAMVRIAQLDPEPAVEGIDPAEQIPAGACAFYDEDD